MILAWLYVLSGGAAEWICKRCGWRNWWRCVVFLLLASAAFACGTERWSVKIGTDADAAKINMTPVSSTVEELNALPAPTRAELDAKPDGRFPAEMQVYTVTAYLDGFKKEADEDFHIGLRDLTTGSTMVAEMISENCAPPELRNEAAMLRASWQARFGKATAKFRKMGVHKIKVEITGVGFFDFLHGQTDVAKNGFELHRVISWREIP